MYVRCGSAAIRTSHSRSLDERWLAKLGQVRCAAQDAVENKATHHPIPAAPAPHRRANPRFTRRDSQYWKVLQMWTSKAGIGPSLASLPISGTYGPRSYLLSRHTLFNLRLSFVSRISFHKWPMTPEIMASQDEYPLAPHIWETRSLDCLRKTMASFPKQLGSKTISPLFKGLNCPVRFRPQPPIILPMHRNLLIPKEQIYCKCFADSLKIR